MRSKLILVVLFALFLLPACGAVPEKQLANPIEGLSCRSYAGSDRTLECSYRCPDGTLVPIVFDGDPSLSLAKGDFDRRYCDVAPEFTPTTPASASPSPTSAATVVPSLTATVVVPVTSQDSLLSEAVSMCDLGGKLINFRLLEPAPNLSVGNLEVQIADQVSKCYVNPTNPSLLTCSIPNDISFPTRIVVTLDGTVVNDFEYSGLGCSILTTPTSRPRSYP